MKLLGETLQNKRERLGMTLSELEERTHIQRETLMAIERNQFEQLNQPSYAIGFIRKYAQAVNLDSTHLIEKHREELPATNQFVSKALEQLATSEHALAYHKGSNEVKQISIVIAGLVGITAFFWAVVSLVL
ncbi:helix-turn-helix domain-containing protein [Staphylococcus americanisciuri]|uniref:Helix-turn-helix domain-containing protein n=1 Tax=Staphylococcus americanisciuri TaxID=2973940 RepID=A0ABT2F2D7_9STAP|nr:helix-turn-helix domain-containing protein [Staphylococcus americanisciuri]MCS4486313.1 helix-turn-helix domain-containing protein [Staphylococcus americanisciuri]